MIVSNYVYILLCNDSTLYTGWTNDPESRVCAHNAGSGAKYTKMRLPVKLVYLENLDTKTEALKRELEIKKLSRRKKLELIAKGKLGSNERKSKMEEKIRHMVIFCLKYEIGSKESNKFLSDGKEILSKIPGVEEFHVYRQISPKNEYDFGFSMEFTNKATYSAYCVHPLHVDFVDQRWKTEVTRFLEIDLV
jgi:predicted GIY-YIG superfamily endonuclease